MDTRIPSSPGETNHPNSKPYGPLSELGPYDPVLAAKLGFFPSPALKLIHEKTPDVFRPEDLGYKMPVEKIQEELDNQLDGFNKKSRAQIGAAFELMLFLHEGQIRKSDNTPYARHTAKVALRLVHEKFLDADKHAQTKRDEDPNAPEDKYDITPLIIASLLHDSVEDQSDKLASLAKAEYSDVDLDSYREDFDADEQQFNQFLALSYIKRLFGDEAARLVELLSTPDYQKPTDTEVLESFVEKYYKSEDAQQGFADGLEALRTDEAATKRLDEQLKLHAAHMKHKFYSKHVQEAIKDPQVSIIKVLDFLDNADPNDKGLSESSANKYLLVYEEFITRFQDDNAQENFESLISVDVRRKLVRTLMYRRLLLEQRMVRENWRNYNGITDIEDSQLVGASS